MIDGSVRVSTDGQSVDAQARQLAAAGCEKVFQEVASGAKTDARPPQHDSDDHRQGAGFRSLADVWADTTTPHGRLILTVLGKLAEFECELIRSRTTEGRERAKAHGVKPGRRAREPRNKKGKQV